MRTTYFIFWYVYVLNSVRPVFSQTPSQLHSHSICNMATQIQETKASVVRIHAFYSTGKDKRSRAGTGFVYNKQGFLVTRNRCVEGADSVFVFLSDGRKSPAWVVYCDQSTELALLKIPLEGLTPIAIGSSSDLSENTSLALLGNSLGFFPSLTLVKFLGVSSDGMLKLSAQVPPGNSGSPLFDQNGENVGIFMGRICQKYQTADTSATDIGLPIERVRGIVDSVLNSGDGQKGWIGVSVVDVKGKNQNKGVKVVRLVPGGPADQGNICIGDVLVKFEGKSIQNAQELSQWVRNTPPDHQVEILIQKDNNDVSKKNIHVQTEPWDLRRSRSNRP